VSTPIIVRRAKKLSVEGGQGSWEKRFRLLSHSGMPRRKGPVVSSVIERGRYSKGRGYRRYYFWGGGPNDLHLPGVEVSGKERKIVISRKKLPNLSADRRGRGD